MELTVGDRRVRPLTADEVMRMVEAGILGDDEPVELLHGVLTEVSAKTPAHEVVKLRLNRWLVLSGASGDHEVRVEAPIVVPDRTSLPEPDLAAVAQGGDPRRHPTTALLAIEVAYSSLETDTQVKPGLYAQAGVPEYWVVDVEARRLRVFSDPSGDRYASERNAGPDAVVQPSHIEAPPLSLADLFSGL